MNDAKQTLNLKLSMADLKAAWDFCKNDLKQMEESAKQKNVDVEK